MSTEIVELAYSRFASYYSKKNWWSNQPLWSTLSDADKEFWTEYVKSIQSNFGMLLPASISNNGKVHKVLNLAEHKTVSGVI